MKYRRLGKTGLMVSAIGLGAGGRIGAVETDEAAAGKQLNLALDLGINFIDTGSNYGMGRSERRIGRYLKHRRKDFFLATKCGSRLIERGGEGVDVKRDFSKEGIIGCVEESLRRLQTGYVDLIQLHTPPQEALAPDSETVNALKRLKARGLARHIGISADGPKALLAVESGVFDTVQLSYNIVSQEAEAEVLPALQKAGMGVIVKEPAANAFYLGRPRPGEDYSYQMPAWERAQHFRFLAGFTRPSAVDIALRFVLDHPAVSTAIPATVNPGHLRDNARVPDLPRLDPGLLSKITDTYRAALAAEKGSS